MRVFLRVTYVFLTIFAASPAVADGPGWTANSTVVKVVATANGGVNVRLSPDLSGCTSQSGYGQLYASLYPDHPGIDRIYSALLAAYMSNKVVAIYLSDSACKIYEVRLGGN